MFKKIVNKMKTLAQSAKAKAVATMAMVSTMMTPVFATAPTINGNLDFKTALGKLLGFFLDAALYVGAFIAIWGGIQFFMAFKEGDAERKSSAIYTFITGCGIISIRVILTTIGVFTA